MTAAHLLSAAWGAPPTARPVPDTTPASAEAARPAAAPPPLQLCAESSRASVAAEAAAAVAARREELHRAKVEALKSDWGFESEACSPGPHPTGAPCNPRAAIRLRAACSSALAAPSRGRGCCAAPGYGQPAGTPRQP